jgi:5'-deoxynucleotidase YfbR-like HD superfamily hydrolase|tara:strand:- start:2006 stop:2683 length:678 start_codon:yes stop_codon:yes gene_type:complete
MDIIKLFNISQSMAAIKRYSQLHLLREESVLEHTGFVCLFTYLLCEELNFVKEEKIFNTGLALEGAVVHDIDEVVTGDIPRPTKYYSKASAKIFNKIAEQGINQIVNELCLSNPENVKNRWAFAKEGREGIVVALADLSSVVFKIWEEVILLGNKKLIPQGSQVMNYIYDYRSAISEENLKLNVIGTRQRLIIVDICEQLTSLCLEITDLKNPSLGIIKPLKGEL